ncbi:MAG: ATP-binding protein [Desulfobacteraceae bacterium]
MFSSTSFKQRLLLRVGVVGKGSRCLSILRMLNSIKPRGLHLKIMGIVPVSRSIAINKYAGEMGVAIYNDCKELLAKETLDLILDLTDDSRILAQIQQYKPESVGILDHQASMLFFDIAHQYEQVEEQESEISIATSFASTLLEASPDGVIVIDRNFRIVNCNDSQLITGGKGRESVLGKHCFDVIHGSLNPCTGPDRICPVQETLKTGRPARAVHEFTNKEGEVRVHQSISYPLFNVLGEIVQMVEIVRDITNDLSERIEQRTRAIRDDLARVAQEDRLASIGRLVASVCHEINNPISSIVTFNKLILSYIQEDALPPDGLKSFVHYLELCIKEALRCGEIVKNLLTFAGHKSLKAANFDLVEMAKTIVLLASHQLKMADIDWEVHFPEPPFTAWGDYALIQQCLMNLVFNAMDSMPNGGKMTLTGGRDAGEDKVWISLADTGHGIDEQHLPKIFEPFYSTKADGKGVGLGLSMVYGIIREHNGHIEVESEPGMGTVFKITLPCKPIPIEEIEGDAHGTSNASAGH